MKVKVVGLPANNDPDWNISENLLGCSGIVVGSVDSHIIINFGEYGRWNFPLKCDGLLAPVVYNKWNPTGYIPIGIPLKLP